MKKCSKCDELKPETEFYKNSSTKDGLQPCCKTCQNEYNKVYQAKKRLQKRNTQLKRFSHYHLHKGLKYRIIGKQKKGETRKEVEYYCLDCGKLVRSTVDLAWVYKFKCDDCRLKGATKPLFLTKSQEQKENKNKNLYTKLNNCTGDCCNDKKECKSNKHKIKGMTFNSLDEVLNVLHAKEEPEDIKTLGRFIVIEKPVIKEVPVFYPVEKKTGILNWFKNLFKPRK